MRLIMEKNRYLLAREQCGEKLAKAADSLNIDEKTLAEFERGSAQPDALLVAKMAQLYHKTCDWLIGLED